MNTSELLAENARLAAEFEEFRASHVTLALPVIEPLIVDPQLTGVPTSQVCGVPAYIAVTTLALQLNRLLERTELLAEIIANQRK